MNFLKIDPKGHVLNAEGHPITDGAQFENTLRSTRIEEHKYVTSSNEVVEVYDYVFLIESIDSIEDGLIKATTQQGLAVDLDPKQFILNYRDQYIICTPEGVPALLSDEAQDELLNLSDEFSDDDITLNGETYPTPFLYKTDKAVSDSKFWSGLYEENDTGWDINEASPALVWAMQKFKLPKMRVAVLGCGRGHDAHYLSTQGHKVVGFDFSQNAIDEAKKLYGEYENLSWQVQDVFNIKSELKEQFDLVCDHTLFCAIDPENRNRLIKAWDFLLAEQGQLLGIFYTMPKNYVPPYGATEAEIKDRISPYFRTDFWMRSRVSIDRRMGKELIVLATKSEN